MYASCRLGIADGCSYALACRNAQPGAQKLLWLFEREQLFEGGLPLFVEAALAALGVDLDFGLGRGPVVVDVGVEEAGVELVESRGVGRTDVSPADVFAHDGGVFRLYQAVVAALAGAALGLLDEQLLQQLRHGLVDEFAAVAPHEALGRKSRKPGWPLGTGFLRSPMETAVGRVFSKWRKRRP